MSAAAAILPLVWATAERVEVPAYESVTKTCPKRIATPELAFYRKYTEGLLRRYVKLSMEAGRTPSLLGRELFRGNVTNYQVKSFDDVVIFVHDMEKCLTKLELRQQLLIERIAMQEYTLEEAAGLLGLTLRTVVRRYRESLDRMTQMLLEKGLLEPLKASKGGAL